MKNKIEQIAHMMCGGKVGYADGGEVKHPSAIENILSNLTKGHAATNQTWDSSGYAAGGMVPGKARHPGVNDQENDTVDAKLTPGEEVIPLSKMKSEKDAHEFVTAEFKKHAKKDKKA